MQLTKDLKLDVAYIRLRKGKVARTAELRPGIIVDFDAKGEILGLEILSLAKLAPAIEFSGMPKPKRRAA